MTQMTPQDEFNHAYQRFADRMANPETGHGSPALPGMTPWSATKSSLREEGLDEDIIEAAELQLLAQIDMRTTAELLIDRIALPHELAHGGVATSQVIHAMRGPLSAMGAPHYPAPARGSAQARARQDLIEDILDSVLMHSGPGRVNAFDEAQVEAITALCMAAWEHLSLDTAELASTLHDRGVARDVERGIEGMSLDFD